MNSISVCIPIYNFKVNSLVNSLLYSFKECSVNYEILLLDDASKAEYQEENRELAKLSKVLYKELPHNIGRSAIRNMFLKYAKFENVLFLDCDTSLINNKFIANYLSAMHSDYEVICGGIKYGDRLPDRQYLLRWKYGIKRECRDTTLRKLNKYKSFISGNFILKKSILENIMFDDRLRNYGHEDSLFAFNLMISKINILHINNPTIHNFNDTAKEFLQKTRQGISNLAFIHTFIVPTGKFAEINRLLKTYENLKKYKLTSVIAVLSPIFNPILLFLLRNGIANLRLLDLYKLFSLSEEIKKIHKA